MLLQEEDTAISVIYDIVPAVGVFSLDEIKLGIDPAGAVVFWRRRRRRPGQEVGSAVVLVIDEEATHRVREEKLEEQLALIDEVAPRLADTTRLRTGTRPRTTASKSSGRATAAAAVSVSMDADYMQQTWGNNDVPSPEIL
jgi:hypothetical protein